MDKKNWKCSYNHSKCFNNHIVGDEIVCINKPHDYQGPNNKNSFFANILIDKLNQKIENGKLEFTKMEENKNIFKTIIDSKEYLFFIRHTSNGGNPTSKKIQIITNNEYFLKLINNYKKICLIINIYVPYTKYNKLDHSNSIFFVVDPNNIVKSKAIKTKNPSSRWVSNDKILNIIQSKNKEIFYWNSEENVYIIHCTKIYEFFKIELPKIYQTYELNNKSNDINGIQQSSSIIKPKNPKPNNRILELKLEGRKIVKSQKNTQKLRDLFRKILRYSFKKCQVKNCDISIPDMLVASHIKPVHKIINDKKMNNFAKTNEILDEFNGFLLCANHDKLFDRFLMTVQKNCKIELNNKLKTEYYKNNIFLKNTLESSIEIEDISKYEKYLKFHRNEFKKKINLKD